ncbi:MAG TPA: hypothetical protein VF944_07825 [Candidatus Bathyarchaeia archaeon]
MVKYNDYPIQKVAEQAYEKVQTLGATVHQKWTCRHCGSRQTMETPNVFYKSGRCEECDKITIIEKCNYLLHVGSKGK